MTVKFHFDKDDQSVYTIQWPNTQLNFYLVQRDSKFDSAEGAVYILMDKFRRCFYIGETGASKNGGVFNRFQTHKWEKKFWDCALVICDSHGDFKQDDVRKWFEWKLNEIARQANTSVVLSSAGRQDEPYGVGERMSAILAVCRFIGISWAFLGDVKEATLSNPVPAKKSRKPSVVQSVVSAQPPENWKNKTQLSRILARLGGNEGSFGHVGQILACKRACMPDSKWRPVLEQAGIKFDKSGHVIDWSAAQKPL